MNNQSKSKLKWRPSTTTNIAFGFFAVILLGACILSLPISAADGKATPFVDSLFTSTTSVCVTGLVVVNTFEHWSLFGQAVILVLIQCGGLGIVTVTSMGMVILGRKITLRGRMLMQDAYNLSQLSGIVKFMKKVIIGTFLVEGLGALCYMFAFVPEFGFAKGTWVSVFTAVSAFCNAGIDIIGANSLAPYVSNVLVNVVTIFLIVMGGIGFIVWFDVLNGVKAVRQGAYPGKFLFQRLTLHSKIVITTTLILIVGGALLVFGLEYSNPDTIGELSFGDKVMASLFQSVTTRTAGFLTVSQKALRDTTALMCMLFMFIGGSSVGTAGGVKTSSIALVFIAVKSAVAGTEHTNAFGRRIHLHLIRKALAVIFISLSAVFVAIFMLSTFTGGDFVDVMFEVFSAIGTAGLSRDYTGTLNLAGKFIIIVCMYLGRIGPITMAMIIGYRKNNAYYSPEYPYEDITVG